jgi:hypothetical protein
MNKKIFLHSIIAGILAAIASILYDQIYFFSTEADFSKVLNPYSMVGLNIIVCLVAGFLYAALRTGLKQKGEIVFSFLFSIISFASVIFPISMTLPLTVLFPELFPGLAVPMVFFPALAWFTTKPLFPEEKR